MSSKGNLNGDTDTRGRPAVSLSTLERYHAALKRAKVWLSSWEWVQDLRGGGTIYVDPPYLGVGGFVEYTAAGWREADALALADRLAELRSCRVILSEQEPGGGALYHARISAARRCTRHAFERRRNLRGDQMSAVRQEITLVSPAIV
jgi:site-specific DNA-adenine methylase